MNKNMYFIMINRDSPRQCFDIHWTSKLGFNLVQTSMNLVRMF